MELPIKMTLINQSVTYHTDPASVFQQLCANEKHTLLLESSESDSKKNLKSLLIIDSAVRITVNDGEMHLQALNDNGLAVLNMLDNVLSSSEIYQFATLSTQHRALSLLPSSLYHLEDDEEQRLTAPSLLDVFRLLCTFYQAPAQYPDAMFFGGFFSYDFVHNFETILHQQQQKNCPELCFYLAETLLTFDHQQKTAQLQGSLFTSSTVEKKRLENRLRELKSHLTFPFHTTNNKYLENIKVECELEDPLFIQSIKRLQQSIIQGEIFQVVPSRKFYLPCPSPFSAYRQLKKQNPSPYMFFMHDSEFTLFGASPESALKYSAKTRIVEIYPIAGTRPRGYDHEGKFDAELDACLELEMRTDHKELAEHIMLLDLARNDLARICIPGSRRVVDLTKVDRYSHVMHLVSRITGKLRDELDALHAYQACMNMGTLTGAPKIRAMELIAETEQCSRGPYGGGIGYFNLQGDLDTCIIIRSAFIINGIATVQAGCGVVLDSIPQAEADETRQKAQAVIQAIIQAHQLKEKEVA